VAPVSGYWDIWPVNPSPRRQLCEIPGHPQHGHGSHPACMTHGPMHYRPATATWVCAGFDGEGCTHVPFEVPDYFNHQAGRAIHGS